MIFCQGSGYNRDFIYNPNKKWKDWLQFTLDAEKDVVMQILQFPHANIFDMKYEEWAKIMDYQQIGVDTVLIGHSAGGGFILKYMAKNPGLKVRQIILVSPWIDTSGVNSHNFYKDFVMDDSIFERAKYGIDLMISDNDPTPEIGDGNKKIINEISKIRVHFFPNKGHFVLDKLPEILPIIKF